MQCLKCKGTGILEYEAGLIQVLCPVCHGKGKVKPDDGLFKGDVGELIIAGEVGGMTDGGSVTATITITSGEVPDDNTANTGNGEEGTDGDIDEALANTTGKPEGRKKRQTRKPA